MVDDHPRPALTDEAIIVRGGTMQLPHLYASIDLAADRQGYPNLSFFGGNGLDVHDVCRHNPIRNRQVMFTTAGAMRSSGFDPRPQGDPDHVEVRFTVRPTDDELERLRAAFGGAIPNPSPAS